MFIYLPMPGFHKIRDITFFVHLRFHKFDIGRSSSASPLPGEANELNNRYLVFPAPEEFTRTSTRQVDPE